MREKQQIVAYLQKGQWYKADEVERKRISDKGAYMDAAPYAIARLRRRRDFGNDFTDHEIVGT